MTEEQVREHARHLAGLYGMLQEDLSHRVYDIDAHNLCSAVVEGDYGQYIATLYAYSNPTALSKYVLQVYEFILGDVDRKLIDRGGMQDLHTEVRLVNHLYANGYFDRGRIVSFFSSRTVCTTCRGAIFDAMRLLAGRVGFMAYEYKVELHGTITDNVYPIARTEGHDQEEMSFL